MLTNSDAWNDCFALSMHNYVFYITWKKLWMTYNVFCSLWKRIFLVENALYYDTWMSTWQLNCKRNLMTENKLKNVLPRFTYFHRVPSSYISTCVFFVSFQHNKRKLFRVSTSCFLRFVFHRKAYVLILDYRKWYGETIFESFDCENAKIIGKHECWNFLCFYQLFYFNLIWRQKKKSRIRKNTNYILADTIYKNRGKSSLQGKR